MLLISVKTAQPYTQRPEKGKCVVISPASDCPGWERAFAPVSRRGPSVAGFREAQVVGTLWRGHSRTGTMLRSSWQPGQGSEFTVGHLLCGAQENRPVRRNATWTRSLDAASVIYNLTARAFYRWLSLLNCTSCNGHANRYTSVVMPVCTHVWRHTTEIPILSIWQTSTSLLAGLKCVMKWEHLHTCTALGHTHVLIHTDKYNHTWTHIRTHSYNHTFTTFLSL